MQELMPIDLLLVLGVASLVMIFLTYYGLRFATRGMASVSSFTRPQVSMILGIWTFLFIGMFLGVFVAFSMFSGTLQIVGFEWLLGNVDVFIAVIGLSVAFLIPLGYLYIYRGGS